VRQQGKAGGSRPKRARPRNEKHIIGFLFAICAGLSVVLGGLLGFQELLGMPDVRTVASYRPPQATLFYDRNGAVVHRLYSEHRVVVPLNRMHPMVAKAFIAAEDSRFYEHPGLDGWSVLRALINNIRSGRKSQGGSTITQQVAKGCCSPRRNLYP
jgi:penicillin-binding protein 1A